MSPRALERHARHIMLKEIGGPGVQRLAAASVSVIGAGALGGPCAMALAACGVGEIEIWDDDTVDRSNLQRQIQFSEADIGRAKADVLAERLNAQNADVSVSVRKARFGEGGEPTGRILIDASDNYKTRFALNRFAHATARRLVSGAATRWQGQVAVFESGVVPGAPCYQCFVPGLPAEAEACDEVGVVGPLTGVIGMRMALEALKIITESGKYLSRAVWIFDSLSGESRTISLRQDSDCQVCGS